MRAQFQVNQVDIDEARLAVVLKGSVVNGFVQAGMRVQFRSRDDAVSVPIATVESVNVTDETPVLAITMFCNKKQSLERLRVFHVRNTIVEVTS
jgi:hypothetical protein